MSDENRRLAEEEAQQAQREADLVRNRIRELHAEPIQGSFDADHLNAVHAYIFQDLPERRPGIVRDDTAGTWIKHRALEGSSSVYDVPYVSYGVEFKVTEILDQFGGSQTIRALSPDAAAVCLAELYAALDHAHAFYEGNSRTLREFTRELAAEGGYALDWVKTGVGAKERNELYVARDLAVLELAFPDLTPEKAMQTNDRAEYEAYCVLQGLRRAVGNKPLAAIIRDGLSRGVGFPETWSKPIFDGCSLPIRDFPGTTGLISFEKTCKKLGACASKPWAVPHLVSRRRKRSEAIQGPNDTTLGSRIYGDTPVFTFLIHSTQSVRK